MGDECLHLNFQVRGADSPKVRELRSRERQRGKRGNGSGERGQEAAAWLETGPAGNVAGE